MRATWLWFWLLGMSCAWAQVEPPRENLPVWVSVGLSVSQISEIQETAGQFSATCDLRLAWQDPRLAFLDSRRGERRREFGGRRAVVQLTKMWDPGIEISNLRGDRLADQVVDQTVWISSEGRVEWIRRLRGTFSAQYDTHNFPLDRQSLTFDFLAAEYNRHSVLLTTDQASQHFSQGQPAGLSGWQLGRTVFRSDFVSHWNGSTHSSVTACVPAARRAAPYIAPIFTPLTATLLVPMLALWLNRWKQGAFQVEPFELMNITVGGLFATIALTLAIYSSYPFLSSGNNAVGRLFALNFLLLAFSTLVILGLFKTQLSDRPLFSPFVAHELYRAICWVVPAATLALVLGLFATASP